MDDRRIHTPIPIIAAVLLVALFCLGIGCFLGQLTGGTP